MNWKDASKRTVYHAVSELLQTPLRSVAACKRSCTRGRNPHLVHVGAHSSECQQACEHEVEHARNLLKLVEKGLLRGHDISQMLLRKVASMLGLDSSSMLSELHASIRSEDMERIAAANHSVRLPEAHRRLATYAQRGATAGAGAATTALCYLVATAQPSGGPLELAKALCIGVDIVLGHSPIVKRAQYGLPEIPIVGPIGIEWALTIANLIWARIGLFDGGFGIELEDTFNIEFFAGATRVELLGVGVEFKFDFTYCTVCEISMALRQIDGHVATATKGLAAASAAIGRRRLQSHAHPVMTPVVASTLQTALSSFMADVSRLDLVPALRTALAATPSASLVSEAMSQLILGDHEVAVAARDVLQGAVRAHHHNISEIAAIVADCSAGLEVASNPAGIESIRSAAAAVAGMAGSVSSHVDSLTSDSSVSSLLNGLKGAQESSIRLRNTLEQEASIGSLRKTAEQAHFLRTLALGGRPTIPSGQQTPSVSTQAVSLFETAETLNATLLGIHSAVVHGLSGFQTGASSDECFDGATVAESATLRAAMRAHGGYLEGVCCSVRQALVDVIRHLGDERFGKLHRFLEALSGQRWGAAAVSLREGAFCEDAWVAPVAPDTSAAAALRVSRCETAVGTVHAGCPPSDHWDVYPSWAHQFTAHRPRVEVSSAASATLTFDASLSARGVVRCGEAPPAPVELDFEQADVAMHFIPMEMAFNSTLAAALTATHLVLDDATATLRVTNVSSSWRWWASHEQLVARADLLSLIWARGARELCSKMASAGLEMAAKSMTTSLLHGTGAQLFTRSRDNVSAARGAMGAAARMAGLASMPLVIDAGVAASTCAIHCPAGVAVRASRGEDTRCPAAISLPDFVSLPGVVPDEGLNACLAALLHDYKTCHLSKETSDERFLRCLEPGYDPVAARSTRCRTSPVDSSDLAAWWTGCAAEFFGTAPNDIDDSYGVPWRSIFDCASYASLQQAECSCSAEAAQEAHLLLERAPVIGNKGAGCLFASVGSEADVGAENRVADVHALTSRLRTLGFSGETASELEHARRVFTCATAGSVAFEEPCDAASVTCTVEDVLCPIERVVRERGACLLDVPCATDRIERGSMQHAWLQSRKAPAWVQLPAAGCNLVMAGRTAEERLGVWGTSWLAEALIRVDRLYTRAINDANAPASLGARPKSELKLRVVRASLREGGLVATSGASHFQSGLEVQLELDDTAPDVVLEAQLSALASAGFSIHNADCNGPSCALISNPSVARLASGSLRARIDPEPLLGADSAHSEDVCSTNTSAVAAAAQEEAATALEAVTEGVIWLRDLTNGVQSSFSALEDVWRSPMDKAGNVRAVLREAGSIGATLAAHGPSCFLLSAVISRLEPLLNRLDGVAIDDKDSRSCQLASELSDAAGPVWGASETAPDIDLGQLERDIDALSNGVDALRARNAAIDMQPIRDVQLLVQRELAAFSPADLVTAINLVLRAKDAGLLNLPSVLDTLVAYAVALPAQLGVATAFSKRAAAADRRAGALSLGKALRDLKAWISPKGREHWLSKLTEYARIPDSWMSQWMRFTAQERTVRREMFAIQSYRAKTVTARATAQLIVNSSTIVQRLSAASERLLDHASSPFFVELAAALAANLSSLSLTNSASRSVVSDALVALVADAEQLSGPASQLGGEAVALNRLVTRVLAELLPTQVPLSSPLLEAFVAKARREINATRTLQREAAHVARLMRLASSAKQVVCKASEEDGQPAAVARSPGARETIASELARATEQAFDAAGALPKAVAEIRRLVNSAAELDGCLASRACVEEQTWAVKAAARAIGEYATLLDEARVDVLSGVRARTSSAVARAARLTRGGALLATIGFSARSFSQPGPFALQLKRAACREASAAATVAESNAVVPGGVPDACPGTLDVVAGMRNGAADVADGSGRMRAMAAELDKVDGLFERVDDELVLIRAQGASVNAGFAALNSKLQSALPVAAMLPSISSNMRTASVSATQATHFVRDMTSALNGFVGLLSLPHTSETKVLLARAERDDDSFVIADGGRQAAATFTPRDVWVGPDPSAFTSGPGLWQGAASALDQLVTAYAASPFSGFVCDHAAALGHSAMHGGAPEQRLRDLAARYPAALHLSASTTLPYSAVLKEVVELHARSTCLTAQLLQTFVDDVELPPEAPAPPASPGPPPPSYDERRRGLSLHDASREAPDSGHARRLNADRYTEGITALTTFDETAGTLEVASIEAQDPCNDRWVSERGVTADLPYLHNPTELSYLRCIPHAPSQQPCSPANPFGCVAKWTTQALGSASADEEQAFRRNFLQFHFATMPPINPLGQALYKRVDFRFPVPMLRSRYSMQSSTFYSLQWPISRDGCDGCPDDCPDACSCGGPSPSGLGGGGCFTICEPNAVNYLPNDYLLTYKYETLETCSHLPNGEGPQRSSCKATSIAQTDAKGRVRHTWRVKVPRSVASNWNFTGVVDVNCDFCSSQPGASADQSEASCNGPHSAVGDSGRHDNAEHCRRRRTECMAAVEADAVPYYGTLTGIANTGGAIYACGQPMKFDDLPSAAFFLFRVNLLDSGDAIVQEVVPLEWLGSDERSKMGVEKCMVSHQPGWGGRGSAAMGDGPRLWVAPKATGADAWAATARGCWLNLPQNAAPNCDPERQPGCDCNGKEVTQHECTSLTLSHPPPMPPSPLPPPPLPPPPLPPPPLPPPPLPPPPSLPLQPAPCFLTAPLSTRVTLWLSLSLSLSLSRSARVTRRR